MQVELVVVGLQGPPPDYPLSIPLPVVSVRQ